MNKRDLIKLAAEALAEDRWWDFADRLADETSHGGDPPREKSTANDGSHAELADLSVDIEKETGHRFTVDNLRAIRATALAWPPGERDHEVEFSVHRRLRSPKAKGQLAMYKRRAEADYQRSPGFQGSPKLTEHRLRVYRADERPMRPWADKMLASVQRLLLQADTQEALDELERFFKVALKKRRQDIGP